MTRIERELARVVLLRWLFLTLVLSWVVLLIALSRGLGFSDSGISVATLREAGEKALSALPATASLCGPVAALLGVQWMRRTGALGCAMAAGLAPRAILRALGVAGVAVSLFVAAAEGLNKHGRAVARDSVVLHAPGTFAWTPGVARGRALVFRSDTLDVGLADLVPSEVGPESSSLKGLTSLHGDALSVDGLVFSSLGGESGVSSLLAAVNRVAVGGVLLVLAGLLAVGAPERRRWVAPVGTITLMAIAALVVQLTSVELRLGGPHAAVAQVVTIVLTGACGVVLQRRFARRGLRIE